MPTFGIDVETVAFTLHPNFEARVGLCRHDQNSLRLHFSPLVRNVALAEASFGQFTKSVDELRHWFCAA
jgi:hypothetical protein